MNDIIILLVLAALGAFALYSCMRRKNRGCGGDCSQCKGCAGGCAGSCCDSCPRHEDPDDEDEDEDEDDEETPRR